MRKWLVCYQVLNDSKFECMLDAEKFNVILEDNGCLSITEVSHGGAIAIFNKDNWCYFYQVFVKDE